MTGFMKHALFVMGFTVSMAQAGWAQSTPSTSSTPSSSHTHEQKCMNEKDRSKTGPCPLKDPSNKTIPGVADHRTPPPPSTQKPAKPPPHKPDEPSN